MRSRTTAGFRRRYNELPASVHEQAKRSYKLWITNPYHASLHYKRVSQRQPIYSVRIGIGYRALGLMEADVIYWFWIGPHAEYDALLRRL